MDENVELLPNVGGVVERKFRLDKLEQLIKAEPRIVVKFSPKVKDKMAWLYWNAFVPIYSSNGKSYSGTARQ